MSKIVLALGGNALGKSPTEQKEKVKIAAKTIVDLSMEGHDIAIVHGNGPQVGMIFDAFNIGNKHNKNISQMPLSESIAMSQGYIGFHLQNAIKNEMLNRKYKQNIATVITQTIVDKDDDAFKNPTKPIGPFHSEEEAKNIMKETNYIFKEDAGRGWRRVVASPKPIDFVEKNTINEELKNSILICAGGGGVPVYKDNDKYTSLSAVIDKDFSAAKLSEMIHADILIILTAVDSVKTNYGKPNETSHSKINVKQLDEFISENQFAPGSMLPKILAVKHFVNTTNKKAYIGLLEDAFKILKEEKGTLIVKF